MACLHHGAAHSLYSIVLLKGVWASLPFGLKRSCEASHILPSPQWHKVLTINAFVKIGAVEGSTGTDYDYGNGIAVAQ